MDKSQYQQIQVLIKQNPRISDFDLYYLGFFSHFVPNLTLQEIFTHIGNIINLHNDQLITSSEKIEFLIRMLSKKIDDKRIQTLQPQNSNQSAQTTNFLQEYFGEILKVLQKYTNISKFELFYLGRFHAACPSYKIAELFQHINNINALVTQDLIDEEDQVDFLLGILNKKMTGSNSSDTMLNIPHVCLSPYKPQDQNMLGQQLLSPHLGLEHRSKSQEEARKGSENNNFLAVRIENNRNCQSEAEKSVGRDEEEVIEQRMEIDLTEENDQKMSVEVENENQNIEKDNVVEICDNSEQENKNESSLKENNNAPLDEGKNIVEKMIDLESNENDARIIPDVQEEKKPKEFERKDREFSEVASYYHEEEGSHFNDSKGMSVEDEIQEERHLSKDHEGLVIESLPEEETKSHSDKIDKLSTDKKMRLDESSLEKEKADIEEQDNEKRVEEAIIEESREPLVESLETSQNRESMTIENSIEPEATRKADEIRDVESQGKDRTDTLEEEVVITSFKVPERIVRNVKIEADKSIEGASNRSESDNPSELKKLMAQLYPEKDKKAKGTFDDILDSLLNSEESKPGSAQKISRMSSKNSGLLQSNESQNLHSQIDVSREHFTEGQKPIEESLEVQENSNEEQERTNLKGTFSDQDEQPSLNDDTYKVRIHKPIEGDTESQQPDRSFIIEWESKNQNIDPNLPSEAEDKTKVSILQQLVKYIKPSLLDDNIVIKPEENEVRSLLEAATQVDQDDDSDRNISPFPLSPRTQADPDWLNNQVDSLIRACPTVQQSLADLPNSGMEDHEFEEVAQSDLNRNNEEHNEKESLNHVGNTQVSNLPGIAHTLEEEEISRQLLVMMQKGRQDGEDLATQENKMEVEKEIMPVNEMEEEAAPKTSLEDIKSPTRPNEIQEEMRNIEENKESNQREEKKNDLNSQPSVEGEIKKESKQHARSDSLSEKGKLSVENSSNCTLCSTLSFQPLIGFDNCKHRFHEDCLKQRLVKKIDEKRFPLKCPVTSCTNELFLAELVDLLPKESQEKLVIATLKTYIDVTKDVCCCPTPGCSFAFFKSYRPNRFRCALCKNTYCMSCRVAWHQGLGCKDYKQSHKSEEGEEINSCLTRFKQCSDCNFWVKKIAGVSIMNCRCGVSFCYHCGKSAVGQQCKCESHEEQKQPKVQPELFHKAMQAPQEFKSFVNTKTEIGKKRSPAEKSYSGGISGASGYIYRPTALNEASESRLDQKNRLVSGLAGSDRDQEKDT